MKVFKLVSGILCIVISFFVIFQSCAAGLVNIVEENGSSSGTAGFFVALLMIAGGIVNIASRNSAGKSGDITGVILFGIAAIVGFTSAGIFLDLYVWASLCTVLAIFCIIDMITKKKPEEVTEDNAE